MSTACVSRPWSRSVRAWSTAPGMSGFCGTGTGAGFRVGVGADVGGTGVPVGVDVGGVVGRGGITAARSGQGAWGRTKGRVGSSGRTGPRPSRAGSSGARAS